MEVTGSLIIPKDKFKILEIFPDNGMNVRDSYSDRSFKCCPFCRVGDCLKEAIDALDCPIDYQTCLIYIQKSNLS